MAAYSNGQASYYLYGSGQLGEYNNGWNYYLPDGVNSIRQVTDLSGAVLVARSYSPWAEVLSQSGNANALRGYLAGIWDPTSGQMYAERAGANAPATGRIRPI
jgi:hypothetical protein